MTKSKERIVMKKILLSKSIVIEASHRLHAHKGKCYRLHGHSWKVELILSSDIDPKTNRGLDYYHISKFMKEVVDGTLDHQHLNDVLKEDNPTSEYVAEWVFKQAVTQFESEHVAKEKTEEELLNVVIEQVRVWETKNSSCIYTRDAWLAQLEA